tara:strand:- start:198 stop:386 length:189 start_codon:yes stop_codon:yes gene_type:complete
MEYPIKKGRTAIYFYRNRTKVFLFLAPRRGLKFSPWDTRWLLLSLPFLFTVKFYWEPKAKAW